MLQKHSRIFMAGVCCFLLLIPVSVSADDSPRNEGEMDWKLDRVLQDQSEEDQYNTKTELEKKLPELFSEETTDKIESIQWEKNKSMDDLMETMFTKNLQSDNNVEDLEGKLFTADYVAPKPSSQTEDEAKKQSSLMNNVLLVVLIGAGCLICSGIYMMFRKLAN